MLLKSFYVLLLPFLVVSEYCYYREGKESETNYLECVNIANNEPIEGISLMHLKFNTTIPIITKGLISKFKNLKTFYITAANVRKIEPGSFDNLQIEMMDLYHNNLTEIENGTFNSLNVLKFLDLSYNKIHILHGYTFSDLVSLEWLSLNANQLQAIGKTAFSDLKKLRHLYLNYNNISSIEVGTFRNLKSLELLDLSYNFLTILDSRLFNHQNNLKYLSLNNNHIRNVPLGLLNRTEFLEMLDFSQNDIQELKENVFFYNKQLQILSLVSNNMTAFNVTKLVENYTPILQEVYLYHNPWKCENLTEVVKYFESRHIVLASAPTVLQHQVGGIDCYI